MEIGGFIKSKHIDHVRIVTHEKAQELDVFYTEIWKVAVNELIERQNIVFRVKIESIDYYGLKLGKLWLAEIIIPAPPSKVQKREKTEKNWAQDIMAEKEAQEKNKFGEYPE